MSTELLGELIRRAATECGSQKALADRLGVMPHRVSEWKSGARDCPPEEVALIADIAGLPAEEWLARATAWKFDGTDKGERLKKALGRFSRLTVAAGLMCSGLGLGGFGASQAHAGPTSDNVYSVNRRKRSHRINSSHRIKKTTPRVAAL